MKDDLNPTASPDILDKQMESPANLIEKFVISADGTRIHAGALGDPNKPALVFVHGITLSGSIFNELFAKLNELNEFYLVSAIFLRFYVRRTSDLFI